MMRSMRYFTPSCLTSAVPISAKDVGEFCDYYHVDSSVVVRELAEFRAIYKQLQAHVTMDDLTKLACSTSRSQARSVTVMLVQVTLQSRQTSMWQAIVSPVTANEMCQTTITISSPVVGKQLLHHGLITDLLSHYACFSNYQDSQLYIMFTKSWLHYQ
jgi:hypothetical protein